jgi:hypothetical protein
LWIPAYYSFFLWAAAHSSGTTGIAFDGTNFYTSNIFLRGTLNEWTQGGAFIKIITLTGNPLNNPFLIEDLSCDYSQVLGPPPAVPEPGTFVLHFA